MGTEEKEGIGEERGVEVYKVIEMRKRGPYALTPAHTPYLILMESKCLELL